MEKFASTVRKSLACTTTMVAIGILPQATAGVLYQSGNVGLDRWATDGAVTTLTDEYSPSGALVRATSCGVDNSGCMATEQLARFMGLSSSEPLSHISGPNFVRYPLAGSAMRQDIYLNAASTLSFDYRSLTNEIPGDQWGDFTVFVLDGTPFALGLTSVSSGWSYSATGKIDGYQAATDWGHFSVSLDSGWHSISFGAWQAGDNRVETALLVDNVTVPEPNSIALFGVAGVALGFLRRRKS